MNPWCFADLELAGNSFGSAWWLKKFWKDPLVFFPPHVGFQDAFDVFFQNMFQKSPWQWGWNPAFSLRVVLLQLQALMRLGWISGAQLVMKDRNLKEKWKHVSFRWYVLMCYLIFTASQLFYHFGVFLYDMLKPTNSDPWDDPPSTALTASTSFFSANESPPKTESYCFC